GCHRQCRRGLAQGGGRERRALLRGVRGGAQEAAGRGAGLTVEPRAIADRVLRELPGEERIYAVLDGARDRSVRSWVIRTHAPSWCLYSGDLTAALENAAPWLLRLTPGGGYLEQFSARA